MDGPRGRGLRRRRNQAAPAEPPSPVATTQPADDPAATSAAETPSEATGTGPAATVPDEELETIVRAWSAALNGGDNEAAADLFAPGAIIVQAGVAIQLEDRAAAIRWNADLPCSGTIVDLDIRNGVVLAVFEFGDRSTGPCDAAPGKLAAAAFLIENGKIAVWQQVAPPENLSPSAPRWQAWAPGPAPRPVRTARRRVQSRLRRHASRRLDGKHVGRMG